MLLLGSTSCSVLLLVVVLVVEVNWVMLKFSLVLKLCGVDRCWHVLKCVEMCWNVLKCVDKCWNRVEIMVKFQHDSNCVSVFKAYGPCLCIGTIRV